MASNSSSFAGPFQRQRLINGVSANDSDIIHMLSVGTPYPVTLAYSTATGLYLAASRAINAGELILREAPVSLALESRFNHQYCGICTQPLDSSQLNAWIARPTNDPDSVLCEDCACNNYVVDMNNLLYRLGIRVTVQRQQQQQQQHRQKRDEEIEKYDAGLYRMNFRLLLGYAESIRNALDDDVVQLDMRAACMLLADDLAIDKELSEEVERIAKVIHKIYTDSSTSAGVSSDGQESLSCSQIGLLCRIMISNQHAVMSDNGKHEIGRAFYPLTALLNHSCMPNIDWHTSPKSRGLMECRAAVDIPAGTPLTIAYLNPRRLAQFATDRERKQFLLKERGFLCACGACAGRCNLCNGPDCTASCSRCRLAAYCCAKCQREDWPAHKLWCNRQRYAYHSFT